MNTLQSLVRFLAGLIFTGTCSFVMAQTPCKIRVVDKDNRAISSAVIRSGKQTCLSNKSGYCLLLNVKTAAILTAHKLGFADTSVVVTSADLKVDTFFVTIKMRFTYYSLPEVAINASGVAELNPLKADFIMDYELQGNFIITLLSRDYVLISDLFNSVLSHANPLENKNEIVRDAEGAIYLCGEAGANRIAADSSGLRIDMQTSPTRALQERTASMDAVTDSFVIMRSYSDLNQSINYIALSKERTAEKILLKKIGNEDRKNAVMAYLAQSVGLTNYLDEINLNFMTANYWQQVVMVMDAKNKADMLENHYLQPNYSVARVINDSVFLFAHDIDSIFVFDKYCKAVRSIAITYHHLPSWGKELIVNEEHTKVYVKLIIDSRPVLFELNLINGNIQKQGTVLNSAYPQKIRIKKNKVYYLSKRKTGPGKTIFRQDL